MKDKKLFFFLIFMFSFIGLIGQTHAVGDLTLTCTDSDSKSTFYHDESSEVIIIWQITEIGGTPPTLDWVIYYGSTDVGSIKGSGTIYGYTSRDISYTTHNNLAVGSHNYIIVVEDYRRPISHLKMHTYLVKVNQRPTGTTTTTTTDSTSNLKFSELFFISIAIIGVVKYSQINQRRKRENK
jgi:hypothetical protein